MSRKAAKQSFDVFSYFQPGRSEFADDIERWLLHSGSCLKSHTFVHKCVRESLRENVTLGEGENSFLPLSLFCLERVTLFKGVLGASGLLRAVSV